VDDANPGICGTWRGKGYVNAEPALVELTRAKEKLTFGIDYQRSTVKDELVLATDAIDVDEWDSIASCNRTGERSAALGFAAMVGRCVWH
jgi:hypothetical protein